MSFNATTVPGHAFEIEAGAALGDGGAAAPLFFKYGLTQRVELELGLDAVRRVETDTGHLTSIGDVTLGGRARLVTTDDGTSFAAAAFAKLPSAKDGAGSGEIDVGAVAIASRTFGRFSLDGNLWLASLGQPDGGSVGQFQAVITLGLPAAGGFAPFAEAAWQHTAGDSGDGGFFDAGVAYAASPRAVFDLAVGAGWSDGYPDWQVSFGWTVLLAPRDG